MELPEFKQKWSVLSNSLEIADQMKLSRIPVSLDLLHTFKEVLDRTLVENKELRSRVNELETIAS